MNGKVMVFERYSFERVMKHSPILHYDSTKSTGTYCLRQFFC